MYNAWLRMGGSCDTAMSLLTNMGESNMNNDGRLTPLGARLVDRFLDSLSFLRLCPSLVGVFLIDDSGRRLSWVDEEGILGMVLEKSVIINEMGEDQEEEEVQCNTLTTVWTVLCCEGGASQASPFDLATSLPTEQQQQQQQQQRTLPKKQRQAHHPSCPACHDDVPNPHHHLNLGGKKVRPTLHPHASVKEMFGWNAS